MGPKKAKVVEGRSQQQRKAVRKTLGKLKDLTVQPRTRKRYEASLEQFFAWLTGRPDPPKASGANGQLGQ